MNRTTATVKTYMTAEELDEKVEQWLRAGVRLVWVVHPGTKTISVHRSLREVTILYEDDILSGDDVVPGFELTVGEIFA